MVHRMQRQNVRSLIGHDKLLAFWSRNQRPPWQTSGPFCSTPPVCFDALWSMRIKSHKARPRRMFGQTSTGAVFCSARVTVRCCSRQFISLSCYYMRWIIQSRTSSKYYGVVDKGNKSNSILWNILYPVQLLKIWQRSRRWQEVCSLSQKSREMILHFALYRCR